MGALTQCNRCSLEQYKLRAKKEGLKLTMVPDRRKTGGVNVYLHHDSVNKTALKKSKQLRETYFVAWFMEVGEECSCD